MSKIKVKLSYAGIGEIMRSEEMGRMLLAEARDRVSYCGEGYFTEVKGMPTRQVATIIAATKSAQTDNYRNNTLLKAFGNNVKKTRNK